MSSSTVQRNTRIAPLPVRTRFGAKGTQESGPGGAQGDISWPHVKWLQSVGQAINGIIVTITVNSNYTVGVKDKNVINVDSTTGSRTITLPLAKSMLDQQIIVKKISSDANSITVKASGTDKIDGGISATFTIPGTSLTFISYLTMANTATWGIY